MHPNFADQIFQNSICKLIERCQIFFEKRAALCAIGLRVRRRSLVHLGKQPRLNGIRTAGPLDLHLRQHCIKLHFQIGSELNSQIEGRGNTGDEAKCRFWNELRADEVLRICFVFVSGELRRLLPLDSTSGTTHG